MEHPVPGQYSWNLEKIFDPNPNIQHITKYKSGILSIDDISIYEFNDSNGGLKISISKNNLDSLLLELGEIPKSGENIVMYTPPTMSDDFMHVTFKNVKYIESLESINGQYMLSYEPVKKVPEEKKASRYIINSFFKNLLKN